jgi:hypothetical protein
MSYIDGREGRKGRAVTCTARTWFTARTTNQSAPYVLWCPPDEEGDRGGLLAASTVGLHHGWASRTTRGGMVSSPARVAGIGSKFKEFTRTL